MCRLSFVRSVLSVRGRPILRKNVVAGSRHCLQNVIASDAARESLATDSLDSRRIRVIETLARARFPKFLSQAIPCSPSGLVMRSRRRRGVAQKLEQTLLRNC
jgi:hypothetical protein